MSSQRFRLHGLVYAAAALALASMLAWPFPAAAADSRAEVAAERGSFLHKDVDPWDDDLDGRKPPPPRVIVVVAAGFELVLRYDGGLRVELPRRPARP